MISADKRRENIKQILTESCQPVTGTELAFKTKVSRQVIVQDMAVLRASGCEIQAGPKGYRVIQTNEDVSRMIVAVRHRPEETEEELTLMVDAGVEVLDVIVEHEVYGELKAALDIAGREDVGRFINRINDTGSSLLSLLTQGIHLHTITSRSKDRMQRAVDALRARGFLLE